MPFTLTPNVHVRRDETGTVRQLSHPQQSYQPDATLLTASVGGASHPLTPRTLAENYLREVAPIYQFAPTAVSNFAAAASPTPTPAPSELRFKEEKSVAGAVTVSYDQTHFGLPIWNAGVTVRINAAPMQVTGSQNATHYQIQVTPLDPAAPYVPNRIDVPALRQLLGLYNDDNPRINATRLLIYRYLTKGRLDPQLLAHASAGEATGFAGHDSPRLPDLPIPPVGDNVQDGRHYIVTEVLFTLARSAWGVINWRTFIEPNSGSVLYLRPLVSCAATGAVFLTDPISAGGGALTAATAAATLDALRTTVSLEGLGAPIPANGQQQLAGQFVKLADVDPPVRGFPTQSHPFQFDYSAPTDDFAACSAYHHCDWVFRLIQGMGIDVASYFNNTDFPVPVDPHALEGQVNAEARANTTGNGMGAFVFGIAQPGQTMGIAADARVVLHEFGHALLWDHLSSPNFGFAHSAGDSLAAILHDPDSKAPDRCETFPFMAASAGLSRRHDRSVAEGWAWFGPQHRDLANGVQYLGEQILSTTMFRIYCAAGGDAADLAKKRFAARHIAYLIIKGCGLMTFETPDPDVFVSALIESDATTPTFDGFPGGMLDKLIRWSFEKQGLYQGPGAPFYVMNEGDPPPVDIFIDDSRAGEYMPYLQNPAASPAIWNRHAPDAIQTNQPPAVGARNYLYAVIGNRGTDTAAGVVIRAFQSRTAGPQNWPADWLPTSTPQLAIPTSIPSRGSVIAGPFEWTPNAPDLSVLLAATAPSDRTHLDALAGHPIPTPDLVRFDNNIAMREFP